MLKRFITLVLIWLVNSLHLAGEQPSSTILTTTYVPDLEITELKLANGMRVLLKPTDFEEGEVLVRITALAGYSTLELDQRASGEAAALTAWESGMGEMTSDNLSALLYKYSLEFNPKITAFSRVIEGNSDAEGLNQLLHIIHLYFNESKFTQEAFTTVVNQNKECLAKASQDRDYSYENTFKSVNTSGYPFLQPLTLEGWEKANYAVSKHFFEDSFADPSEFVCVIVGNFKTEDVIPIVRMELGGIRHKPSRGNFSRIPSTHFPNGISTKKVLMAGRSDSLARLTFPLADTLNVNQLHAFEVGCEVIEERLRELFRKKMRTSLGIDVGYELPLYPLLSCPWVVIQFRTPPQQVEHVKMTIIEEIKKIAKEGPTQEELDKVLLNLKRADAFWTRDNAFWVATLSNYSLWGWDLKLALKNFDVISQLKPEDIKKMMAAHLSLTHYSLVYTQP